MVRATVNSNKLLMLNYPLLEQKISFEFPAFSYLGGQFTLQTTHCWTLTTEYIGMVNSFATLSLKHMTCP